MNIYAIVDDAGKCYDIRSMACSCVNKYYVPIETSDMDLLYKYYYPLPEFLDSCDDFCGRWYFDATRTIPILDTTQTS